MVPMVAIIEPMCAQPGVPVRASRPARTTRLTRASPAAIAATGGRWAAPRVGWSAGGPNPGRRARGARPRGSPPRLMRRPGGEGPGARARGRAPRAVGDGPARDGGPHRRSAFAVRCERRAGDTRADVRVSLADADP